MGSTARGWLQLQIASAAICALTPILEINALLGQAAADPDYPGPAPHEFMGEEKMVYSLSHGLLGKGTIQQERGIYFNTQS